jgi:hypothetical protein
MIEICINKNDTTEWLDIVYVEEGDDIQIIDYRTDIDLYIYLDTVFTDIAKLKQIDEFVKELDESEIVKLDYLFFRGYDIDDITFDTFDNIFMYDSWVMAIDEYLEFNLQDVEFDVYKYIDFDMLQKDLELNNYVEYNDRVFKEV